MGFTVERDVEYGTTGSRSLHCDVFHPEPTGTPAPAAILLHGGGWRRGSRATMHPRAEALAAQGILAVAAEYRLTDEAPWPAHVNDVKACLRWLRANAEARNADPDQISLVGFSAGAHLALMAAATPGDPALSGNGGHEGVSEVVDAVIAFFPPVRIIPGADRDNDLPASAGDSLGEGITADEARVMSPIERVTPGFPPTLLLHGTADEVVPSRSSQQFYEAVTAVGTAAELRLYSGQRHEFVKIEEMLDLAMRDVALFVRRVLVDPARFDVPQAELFGAPAAR